MQVVYISGISVTELNMRGDKAIGRESTEKEKRIRIGYVDGVVLFCVNLSLV